MDLGKVTGITCCKWCMKTILLAKWTTQVLLKTCLDAKHKEVSRTPNYLQTKCRLNCRLMLTVTIFNRCVLLHLIFFLAWVMLQWALKLIHPYINLTFHTKKLRWVEALFPMEINRPDTSKPVRRRTKRRMTTTLEIVIKARTLRCSTVNHFRLMSKMNSCKQSHRVTIPDSLTLIIFTTQATTHPK